MTPGNTKSLIINYLVISKLITDIFNKIRTSFFSYAINFSYLFIFHILFFLRLNETAAKPTQCLFSTAVWFEYIRLPCWEFRNIWGKQGKDLNRQEINLCRKNANYKVLNDFQHMCMSAPTREYFEIVCARVATLICKATTGIIKILMDFKLGYH